MKKISFSNYIAWQVFPDKSFVYVCNFKTRKYYTFEDSGMVIWLCIADNEPISQTVLQEKIAEHYNVKCETIVEDIDEFVSSLVTEGLIEYNE